MKQIDTYIIHGQSLADGSAPNAALPSGWGGPIKNATNTAYIVNYGSGAVQTLEIGVNNAATLGEWGIEAALGWDYVNSGRDVLIIKVAKNGAPQCDEVGRQDWNWGNFGNKELFWRLERNIKLGFQWATQNNLYPNVVAMISKQGERDATTAACAGDYYDNLNFFNKYFIGKFGLQEAKIIDALITNNIPQPTYQYYQQVNQAKINVMSQYMGFTILSDAWQYKADGIHINAAGTLQFYQDVKTILQ